MEPILFYIVLCMIAIIWVTKFALGKNKNLPPSPFPSIPIVGHLYLLRSPLYRCLAKLSDHHGPMLMLRFGSRRVFLVSSPAAVEECLTTNDLNFANRPLLLAGKHLGNDYTALNWSNYGHHLRSLRRIVTLELLSAHRLKTFNTVRAAEVHNLVKKVYNVDGNIMEMKTNFFELMLNLTMMTVAGRRSNEAEARRFKEIVQESFKVMGMTNMSDYLPWWKLVGGKELEEKMVALKEKWFVFMQDLIEEQRRKSSTNKEEKKNFIEVLLMLQETEPEYHNDEFIRGLLQVVISAGTYTSSVTMEWMLSLLLNNPKALKKAQAEIDSCVGEDRLVNESDLANLPYLRCVINETMRIYPPAPLVFHESEKDCSVGGYHIPRGTMLLMNFWAVQNDPKNWEDTNYKFKPERFVGLEGSEVGYKLLPFGAGRRGCPGENLAMRMIGLTMGTLLQCFEWERPRNEMIDMTEGSGLITPKSKALVVKCQARSMMAKLLSHM